MREKRCWEMYEKEEDEFYQDIEMQNRRGGRRGSLSAGVVSAGLKIHT